MSIAEREQSELAFGLVAAEPEATFGHHALPRGAILTMAHGAGGFAELESGWRQLQTRSPDPALFQGFDWLNTWVAVYGRAPDDPQPLVIAGHLDGELVFAWALMRQRIGPLTVLRWMSEPLAQYGDILVAPGQCPKAWLSAALDRIRVLRDVDIIRLRHVRDDANAAPFLRQHFRNSLLTELAPWLDLSAFANEAAYDARYTANQRKRRKKIRKALEDAFGPITFDLLEPGAEMDNAIAAAVVEKCQWLDQRGRQNRALCDRQIVEFLRRLSGAGGDARLVVSRMCAGPRPVSWEIGLRKGGTHFGFITSHVTALTDYSPARLHMDLSQRRALNDGLKAFDLMVPNDAHKESWSSAKTETSDYHLPLSPLGRLYGAGYLETARPLLRRAYYRMPPHLLRLLKPVVGH